jgi:hypothetical protein
MRQVVGVLAIREFSTCSRQTIPEKAKAVPEKENI